MIQSRVFVFLAVTLCFGTCFCADAEADKNKEKAEEDVKTLQTLTARVFEKAQTKLRRAKSTKDTVESQKEKALRAESDVKTAAAQITSVERKAEAESVVQRAKRELDECDKLYQKAKNKADEASQRMDEFLQRARELNNKAQKELQDALSQSDNYAQVIGSAQTATTQTEALNREIDGSTVLSTADIALSSIQDGAKKVQVVKYQAESLATVSNIEAKMSEAKVNIQSIEAKREEINTIVQAMEKNVKSAPDASKGLFNSLYGKADSQLQTASRKVTEANKCSNDMQQRKTEVDKDLAILMATTDESSADTQAKRVVWHETFFTDELKTIKRALQTAATSVSSAQSQQQQMLREMSQNNRQSPNELKEKPKNDIPTEEVTNPIGNAEEKKTVTPSEEKPIVIQTDKPEVTDTDKQEKTETAKPNVIKTDGPAKTETEKPETTDTEKSISEKSEETMDKKSEQPVDANLDRTKENKSVQLTHKEKQDPKDDNSELLNNDKLRNITKEITNNSLIGGEVPTRSAANDSAVTVFIPLLVILVMSAVLH